MSDIVSPRLAALASELKQLLSVYEENFDLVQIGAYQTDPTRLDRAISLMPRIDGFLRQGMNERSTIEQATVELEKLLAAN